MSDRNNRSLNARASRALWTMSVVLLAVGPSGCSGGCSLRALPAPLPASQTIEGGAQVRISHTGLAKITSVLETIVNNNFANGLCVPAVGPDDLTLANFYACNNNDCAGGAEGCRVNFNIDSLNTSVPDAHTLEISVTFDASASVPVTLSNWIGSTGCTLGVSVSNSNVTADINVDINSTTGELAINLSNIGNLDINPDISGCGFVGDILDGVLSLAFDLFSTSIGNYIVNLLTPTLNNFIQGVLPNPLGIEGLMDLGSVVASIDPSKSAPLELRGVPGGYAQMVAGGGSLGVILGLNSDRDTSTRTATTSSQPALCMPQWPAPDLSAAPASLPKVAGRNTFAERPANDFLGSPDPASDLVIGLSKDTLNLAGDHVMASGLLCIDVTPALSPELTLGTVGILIQSLGSLGTGKEPLLLVVRPTTPLTFDIGDGTMTSPSITAHIENMAIDFYALIDQRYIRALTVSIDVDMGVNLSFMLNSSHQEVVVPALVGLTASAIHVTVTNTDLLRETPTQLAAVFPSIINLVLPLLASSLPTFPVPSLQGFTLGGLKLAKIHTAQDDFLAIYASLVQSTRTRVLETGHMEPENERPIEPPVPRATTTAQLVSVNSSSVDKTLAFVNGQPGGELPSVTVQLGGEGPHGKALEWQWNLDGGMWRPFVATANLTVSDPSFALQGAHVLNVRSREIDDYDTTDLDGTSVPFVIDSVPPRILVDQIKRDGDGVVVPGSDLVTADANLLYAFGPVASAEPTTGWTTSGGLVGVAALRGLVNQANQARVYVKDEAGNVGSLTVDFTAFIGDVAVAAPQASGCQIGDGGTAGGAGWALLGLLVPMAVIVRVASRRRGRS